MRKNLKSHTVAVRFTEAEYRHIKSIVDENSGTISEFVRVCVNTALAQEGDPEAVKLLSAMFEKGIAQAIKKRVEAEIRVQTGEGKGKRS